MVDGLITAGEGGGEGRGGSPLLWAQWISSSYLSCRCYPESTMYATTSTLDATG